MPGIILSLLATLIALSFAFYTDDWSARNRKSRRTTPGQISKPFPGIRSEDLGKAESAKDVDISGSSGASNRNS
jgi:hypothetical protein